MEPRRLLEVARRIQAAAQRPGLARAPHAPPKEPGELYDLLIVSEELRSVSRGLFLDGHYAQAVGEAYKCLNNRVKQRSRIWSRDGADLMHHVFNEAEPVLALSPLRTVSERDEQTGYRFILAGCMTGVRNPRAHEHDLRDDAGAGLQLLVWADHLMRVVARAKRTRRKKNTKG